MEASSAESSLWMRLSPSLWMRLHHVNDQSHGLRHGATSTALTPTAGCRLIVVGAYFLFEFPRKQDSHCAPRARRHPALPEQFWPVARTSSVIDPLTDSHSNGIPHTHGQLAGHVELIGDMKHSLSCTFFLKN
jgi:hypothetical protein